MKTKLGTCCGCGARKRVRGLVCLPKKSPIPGHGWGCLVCDLPADGAMAVLCDRCFDRAEEEGLEAVLRFACRGYPATDGRVPIGELQGIHEHDLSQHPEACVP